eukprot:TRINITY_DN9385_c3_g1_i1.p1 TRINITY_DN9385_c3_g1~~TRINITY_DN9385_c3_g1_i1.p1  ORF type:complete len:839 (-),score=202.87 TRINITY_DN9385_c3_g1_i1:94-2460(-)
MDDDPSQLSLVAGDLVRVQCRDASGWTYGRLECAAGSPGSRANMVGAAGWFPEAVLGAASQCPPHNSQDEKGDEKQAERNMMEDEARGQAEERHPELMATASAEGEVSSTAPTIGLTASTGSVPRSPEEGEHASPLCTDVSSSCASLNTSCELAGGQGVQSPVQTPSRDDRGDSAAAVEAAPVVTSGSPLLAKDGGDVVVLVKSSCGIGLEDVDSKVEALLDDSRVTAERRLEDCARLRQRFLSDKEDADRGAVEAETFLEGAERLYQSLEEQERKCRAEAACVAGCSSSSLRRNLETKLRMLETKKDVAASNLRNARERLESEKRAAGVARRRLRTEQSSALAAVEAVSRHRCNTSASQTNGVSTPTVPPGGSSSSVPATRSASPVRRRCTPAEGPALATCHRTRRTVASVSNSTSVAWTIPSGEEDDGGNRRPSSTSRITGAAGTGSPSRQNGQGVSSSPAALRRSARGALNSGGNATSSTPRRHGTAVGSPGASISGGGSGAARGGSSTAGAPPPTRSKPQAAGTPVMGGHGPSARDRRDTARSRSPSSTAAGGSTVGSRQSTQQRGSSASRAQPTGGSGAAPAGAVAVADGVKEGAAAVSSTRAKQQEELKSRAAEVLQNAAELQAKLAAMPAELRSQLSRQSAGLRGLLGLLEAASVSSRLSVTIVKARGLRNLNFAGDAPRCACEVKRLVSNDETDRQAKWITKAAPRTLEPVWNETFDVDTWSVGEPLEFTVFDTGLFGDQPIEGKVSLPSDSFYPDGFEGDLPISGLSSVSLYLHIVPVL